MRKVGNFTLYSFEEVQDEVIGPRGTPRRERLEREVEEAINAYYLGEAVKQAKNEDTQGEFEVYTFEEVLDETIGKKGTPEREAFDRQVEEDVRAWRIGQAVKDAREEQHLTREQLGERAGVKPALVGSIERGRFSLRSLGRVLRALGKTGSLEIAGQKVALA